MSFRKSDVVNLMSAAKFFICALMLLVLSACSENKEEQNAQAHVNRAKAYEDQGQYRAAMIEYKNAIQKGAGHERSYLAYANMLNDMTQHSAALSILEQYQGEKSQAFYTELVEAYVGMKKYLTAEATLSSHINTDNRELGLLKAKIASGKGRFAEALTIYEALLEKAKDNGEALLGKAELLLRQKKVDQAKELLVQIQEQDSAYLNAQLMLTGIQIVDGDLEQAEAKLTELLAGLRNTDVMEPEKAAVLQRLSYVLTRLGRTNEAYIYTKLLAEAFPGASEMAEQYQKAVDLFKDGQFDKSKTALEVLVEQYPHNKRAAQLLGIVNYLQGDVEQALENLTGNVDPEVADPLATHIYAASSLKMNDPKKVLEILEPTIQQTQKAETLALYGLAAISDNQKQKGEKALIKAIDLSPENARLRLILASFYRDAGAQSSELELVQLNEAYKLEPTNLTVLKDLMGFYLRQGKTDQAESFIRNQIQNHQDDYSSQLIAGYYYATQKELPKAKEHFSLAAKAASEGPAYRNALRAQGRAELVLEEFKAAQKTFELIVKEFPEDLLGFHGLYAALKGQFNVSDATAALEKYAEKGASAVPYEVLARTAITQQDSESAAKYAQRIKDQQADYPRLKSIEHSIAFLDAVSALQKGNLNQAREIIAPVLVDKPDHVKLLSLLVELELKSGNAIEANKIVAQLESAEPSYGLLPLLKGDVALANKDLPVAKSQYRLAWERQKTEVAASKFYRVLEILKDQQAKELLLKEWLEVNPNSFNAVLFSAMDDQVSGRVEQAKDKYEMLLVRNQNHATVLNNLGWMYFEANDDRALGMLEKAAELSPENPAVLDSYGWVLVKQGQVEKGIPYLEKAQRLAPDVAEISQHLEEARKL